MTLQILPLPSQKTRVSFLQAEAWQVCNFNFRNMIVIVAGTDDKRWMSLYFNHSSNYFISPFIFAANNLKGIGFWILKDQGCQIIYCSAVLLNIVAMFC